MKPFIFDKRNGIHIIDLTKSIIMIKESAKFVREVTRTGDSILFVGTKKQAQSVIKEVAEDAGQPYVSHRWLGGMLTNSDTIRQRVERLKELEKMESDGTLDSMHKKEAAKARHELNKLRRNLSGVADMKKLPGAMFIVDINREAIAVKEANLLNIPVIAMVDTNCDPDSIDYSIAGNDDAIRAIRLVSNEIAKAAKEGNEEYTRVLAEQARKREEEAKKAAEEGAKAKKEKAEAEKAAKKAAKEAEKAAKKSEKTAEKSAKKAAEPKVEATEAPAEEKPAEETAPEAPAKAEAPAEESK
jgi:small subunit ribosomal protein S2